MQTSEADLPICAARAVCSKIDLYETPWIERQCRCPDPHVKEPEIVYHKASFQKHIEEFQRNRPQRILDLEHSQNDRPYIRELMRKLGTIYEVKDIVLDEESEHIGHNPRDEFDVHRNLFLRRKSNKNRRMETLLDRLESKKMRHVHRGDVPMTGGCSAAISLNDGYTIADKTRQYKVCEPVHKLPICRYFKDYTWTVKSSSHENVTEQIIHCKCPRNSVTYLIKREPLPNDQDGYTYLFACSPQSVSINPSLCIIYLYAMPKAMTID